MASVVYCCMQCGRSFSVEEGITPECCYFDRSKYVFRLADPDAERLNIKKEGFAADATGQISYEFPADIRFNVVNGNSATPFHGKSLQTQQLTIMTTLWGRK